MKSWPGFKAIRSCCTSPDGARMSMRLPRCDLSPKCCNMFAYGTPTLQASRNRRRPPRCRVHLATRCHECRERILIGMDHLHLRAGGSQCLYSSLDRHEAHRLRRRAKREDQHPIAADSQIRVVGRVVSAIDVVMAPKEHWGRAEGSRGGNDSIDQIDATLAVEGVPLPGFRIDSGDQQALFWPRLQGKLGGVTSLRSDPAATATASASAPYRRRISAGLPPACFASSTPALMRAQSIVGGRSAGGTPGPGGSPCPARR